MIPPVEVQNDVPAIRTSVFDRLTFPKRDVNIKQGEDEEEPSIIGTVQGEESGIYKKSILYHFKTRGMILEAHLQLL